MMMIGFSLSEMKEKKEKEKEMEKEVLTCNFLVWLEDFLEKELIIARGEFESYSIINFIFSNFE